MVNKVEYNDCIFAVITETSRFIGVFRPQIVPSQICSNLMRHTHTHRQTTLIELIKNSREPIDLHF